jgi:hypothetical protein
MADKEIKIDPEDELEEIPSEDTDEKKPSKAKIYSEVTTESAEKGGA